ncbi:hypothetical protein MSG28_007767 [Choristoneura fumiferana]|uniref:Uncharacterized protein n=1 Tax=Choristoneura fumiferana TaxID=7141 RepID=A0ACC0JYT5_CHOFU|nr:hypothetical protein MSG28_007767 [Choristoneura fumiferana]
MGLVLSAIISYAGVLETIECLRHLLAGVLPDTDPDFADLVDYYTSLLQKTANPSNNPDWTTQCGQGYLCLAQDESGKLNKAAVKYYDGQPNSTAILFSTKISSFGQESVESNGSHANGDYRSESRFSENSSERDERDASEISEAKEKLTWHYRPKSPTPQNLPEIHFQSFEDNKGDENYSEDFLRSLDGIKFRPLQRSDPSGRRRSFKKRHSSSSTSSRESRASREEELKLFTSLEEAEFERATQERAKGFGSAPNLAARSYSRSRSREHSKERRADWSVDASVDSLPEEEPAPAKPKLGDLPKLGSFENEEKVNEVNEEDEDELDDFWGNSGD